MKANVYNPITGIYGTAYAFGSAGSSPPASCVSTNCRMIQSITSNTYSIDQYKSQIFNELNMSPLEQLRKDEYSMNMMSGSTIVRRALFLLRSTNSPPIICPFTDQYCVSNTQDAFPDMLTTSTYPVNTASFDHFLNENVGSTTTSFSTPLMIQQRIPQLYTNFDTRGILTTEQVGGQFKVELGTHKYVNLPSNIKTNTNLVSSINDVQQYKALRQNIIATESSLVKFTNIQNIIFNGAPITIQQASLLDRFAPQIDMRDSLVTLHPPYDRPENVSACQSYRTMNSSASFCITNTQWIQVSSCNGISAQNAGPNFCRPNALALGRMNCFVCTNIGIQPQPQLISCIQATYNYRNRVDTVYFALWQCYYQGKP